MVIGLLFWGGLVTGKATGYWQNNISALEYRFHIRHLHLPIYQHNRGQVPGYNKSAWIAMLKQLKAAEQERSEGQPN